MCPKYFFLALLLLTNLLWTFYMTPIVAGSDLRVPEQYPTIQAAINAAKPRDTIWVANGTYYENVFVNKRVTIIGENKSNTIIDGGGTGHVVTIAYDNVEIRGFTIRNGNNQFNGIDIRGFDSAIITDNFVTLNVAGIYLYESSGNTITENTFFNNSIYGVNVYYSLSNNISNNIVSESAFGVQLEVSNTTFITGNEISNNSYGVYITYSSNNTVRGNVLSDNSFGILPSYCNNIVISNNTFSGSTYAVEPYRSTDISILYNIFSDNPSYSIYMAYSNLNTIKGNIISKSDWGIQFYNSTQNTVIQNSISTNTYGMYLASGSSQNTFYHNNIIDNTDQVYVDPYIFISNTWDNGTHGNYWSDYTGTDDNGDGIGDTPYTINAFNKDRYPLMAEWGGIHDVAILNVTTSATNVLPGEIIYINITASNEGTWKETFNVTVKYNLTEIDVQTIDNLAEGANVTLTFIWNTTDVSSGNYTISAEATVVVFETDTADNTYEDGTVTVVKVHDVAVISVTVTPIAVLQGQLVYINVTVENQGGFTESFNVTVYADQDKTVVGDEITIGQQSVDNLMLGANETLSYIWNTTDVQGDYWISAQADAVSGETDLDDNILINGTVRVEIAILITAGGGGRAGFYLFSKIYTKT